MVITEEDLWLVKDNVISGGNWDDQILHIPAAAAAAETPLTYGLQVL